MAQRQEDRADLTSPRPQHAKAVDWVCQGELPREASSGEEGDNVSS